MSNDWIKWALIVVGMGVIVSLTSSIELGAWVILFGAVTWWVWLNPGPGVSLFLLLAPILPMLKITQTLGSVTLVKDVIILTLFICWFAWPLVTKRLPYRRNVLMLPIIVLGLWVIVGVIRADNLVLGILRSRDIMLYPLLFLGVLYMPHTRDVWRQWLKWFLVSLGIVVVMAGYQWFVVPTSTVLRFDPIREIWIPRLSSIMAHPSILGEFLAIGLSMVAAVGIGVKSMKIKWATGIAALVILLVTFLTYTRAAWIGAGVVIIAIAAKYLWDMVRQRGFGARAKKYLSIGVVAVVVVGGAVIMTNNRIGQYARALIDPSYGSNEERLIFMSRLIAPMSNTEAIVGRGLGDVLEQNLREVNVSTTTVATGAAREVQLVKNATLVDNQYLKTLVEMGLVGIIITGWIYWKLFKEIIMSRTRGDSGIVMYWGLGVLAAYVVQGSFIDIWEIFPTNAYFWLAAAMVMAAATPEVQKQET